jgi:hypothetical protein
MGLAIAISLLLVGATVLIHYEGLHLVSRGLGKSNAVYSQTKVLVTIFWIFLIHLIEIALYAFGFWFADVVVDIGSFTGAHDIGLFDYFYFSVEAFSTLGLGDIYPVGPMRLVASIEPINGLLLIGWSTSFTFLCMYRYWSFGNEEDDKS